jgi:hypothetical protein
LEIFIWLKECCYTEDVDETKNKEYQPSVAGRGLASSSFGGAGPPFSFVAISFEAGDDEAEFILSMASKST